MNIAEQTPNTSEFLMAIIDSAPDGIALISTNHEVLIINKLFNEYIYKITGKDITVAADFKGFVSTENLSSYIENFNKVLSGQTLTFEIECPVGNSFNYYRFTMNPVFDSSGVTMGLTLWIKDINEGKRLQIENEHKLENLEAVFENADESIVLLDRDLKVLGFNKVARYRLMTNLKKELFIGADFNDFLYPGKEEVFYDIFNKSINGTLEEVEVHTSSIENVDIWFRSKMFPVYNKKGDLLGVAVFVQNIKDRKLAEIALRESEEKFRRILECVPTPIVVLDKDMKVAIVNPKTEVVFGYPNHELIGHELTMLISDWNDFNFLEKHHEPYRLGKERTLTGLRKDGGKMILEVNVNSFKIKNERFVLVVIQDITDRVNAENMILDQLERLEKIAWQQSHEVRRPVANILGIINVFRMTKNMSEQELTMYLNLLYEVTNELDSIIKKTIKYASHTDRQES